MEEIRIECCECGEDVTAQVLDACNADPDPGTFFRIRVETEAPGTVEIRCSKGHLCQYACPAVTGSAPRAAP